MSAAYAASDCHMQALPLPLYACHSYQRCLAQITINAAGQAGPLADIAISGLSGWVAIFCPLHRGRVVVRVWVPRGIETYVRPPIPVGLRSK